MVTATNAAVTVGEDGIVSACAYCTPRAELDALEAQYPGKVSHGACSPCCVKLLADDWGKP